MAVGGLTGCGDSPTAPAAAEGPGIEAAVIRTEHSFRMARTACNGERVTLVGMSDVVINEEDGIRSAVVRSNGQGAGQCRGGVAQPGGPAFAFPRAAWNAAPNAAAPPCRADGNRAIARSTAASTAAGISVRSSRSGRGAEPSRSALIACAVAPT
jgi:hypothetical protein